MIFCSENAVTLYEVCNAVVLQCDEMNCIMQINYYVNSAEMVPVFEARVRQLAELWSKGVASSGGKALLSVHEDLQRTVRN